MAQIYKHTCIDVNNITCLTAKKFGDNLIFMTIGLRLKAARKHAGLSQKELVSKLNGLMSQQNISQLESGVNKGTEFVVQLAMACMVSPEWLATGKGDMTNSHSTNLYTKQTLSEYKVEPISLVDNPEYPSIRRVNLKLSAGIIGFSIEHDVEDKSPIVMQRQWFESRGYNPAKLLATGLKGDSMSPGMNDGDTIVINTEDTTPVDGIVFAINYEGEMLVKRMVRDAGTWWLSSDNPDQRKYPRKQCTGDLCLIIGRIVHKQSEVI